MSKDNEITEKKLRQRFAANSPKLIARSEYTMVQAESYAKALFNGQDMKYEGNVLSTVKDAENVKSPNQMALYALDKGGFERIAGGENEPVRVDQKKINRMIVISTQNKVPNKSQTRI